MSKPPILIVSGTNRPNSNTLRVANLIHERYRRIDVPAEVYSLEQLPLELFQGGAYAHKPPAFIQVQQRVLAAPGLHIVTPEYNGSFPGMLKFFIDMLKFPESFQHKPVAFVGLAGGVWGALRSVEQLQLIFSYRNAFGYPDRVFLPGIKNKLDENGGLIDADLEARLTRQVEGFVGFIDCLGVSRSVPPGALP